MSINIIKTIVGIFVLLAAQVIILNNIHLFGCATPLLIVYGVIILPTNAPRWLSLAVGFILGIISDIFSNTPGVATTSLTAIAFIQPMLLKLFVSHDAPESLSPSMRTLGKMKFISFSFILVLIYCLLFFALEEFNFFHLNQWASFVGGSTALTFLLLMTIENFRRA